MSSHIKKLGIVGAGPATVYLLYYLSSLNEQYSITILEHQPDAGRGLPYCQANSPYSLLSNLLPDEIPPTVKSFREWCSGNSIALKDEPVPRYLIGQFLHWSLTCLIKQRPGVTLISSCRVKSVNINNCGTFTVFTETFEQFEFDDLVLNTGHGITPTGYDVQFAYPLNELKIKEAVKYVNLIGSSMTAIDCALFLAHKYGSFQCESDKWLYIPSKPVEIKMHSTSGLFPLPFFRSRNLQPEIKKLIEASDLSGTSRRSLDRLYRTVLLRLLRKYAPRIYHQSNTRNFREFIQKWQSSVFHQRADTSLKLGMFMNSRCEEFSVVLAIFEVFFDSLCDLKITFTPEDQAFISSVCIPFLAKNNGALPSTSANKILALMESGTLSIERVQKTSSEPQLPGADGNTVTIDCRAAGKTQRDPLIQNLAGKGLVRLTGQTNSRSIKRIETDNEYRAYISPGTQATIYVSSAPLLRATSNTLPGMSVTANIAKSIADSLAGAHQKECA
ncbi:MAG: hypothetical protein CL587_01265 [Alteromonadaceae bacterium]|nr:hypothetical protein [Alteromonadaceae bacterium]